jgi:hypothetical protein
MNASDGGAAAHRMCVRQSYFCFARSFRMTANGLGVGGSTSFNVFVS